MVACYDLRLDLSSKFLRYRQFPGDRKSVTCVLSVYS